MSFEKARDLLRLAEMAAARHGGVSLQEICEAFDVKHRTAQRMTQALQDCFPAVEIVERPDRRRAWRLREAPLARFRGFDDAELSALDLSIRTAERGGDLLEARALHRLRDRIIAAMPARDARRAESDAEALLEAQGFAARPGPRTRVDPEVAEVVAAALKGPFRLRIAYAGREEAAPAPRIVEPHGLLIGARRYLVARQPERGPGLRHFRLDRIRTAEVLPESFALQPGFDIEAHAARAFGAFQSETEYGEVVWRFAPRAAAHAREFVFHPGQRLTEEPDGALTVRFRASGWTEMTWHLYQWGDAVEVLAPPKLRAMVEGHRRGDLGGAALTGDPENRKATQMARQLPAPGEVFLDHVAHFAPSLDAAAPKLEALGFRLTPFTAQRNRTPQGMVAAGMANRCIMLREGYVEVLTAISDTELARQFRAATARHVGLHLVAFTEHDPEAAHARMTAEGFAPNPPVALTRPVETEDGVGDEARFTVLRVAPGTMPEGRIQMLSHHTEAAVWQPRWLAHANGVATLQGVLLAVTDPEESAARFGRFTGRAPQRRGARHVLELDRGVCVFVAHEDLAEVAPWAEPRAGAPWIVASALGSDDVGLTEARFAEGGLRGRPLGGDQTVYAMPPELGGFASVAPADAYPVWAA